MEYYYIQPNYFRKFRCIGGACSESCCDGWSIDWSNHELDKLRSADCSEKLSKLIGNSFKLSDDKTFYNIRLGSNGKCPFHNSESGLCDIQKELGEAYLGVVCTQYPRHYIEHGNQIIRWCTTSCPAVLDTIFNEENALDIEKVIARDYEKIDRSTFVTDHEDAIKADPIKCVRMELFNFYSDMLFEKSRNVENSIILTAIAVKHLTEAEEKGEYQMLPQLADDLKKKLSKPNMVRSLDELKPNYQLKFKLVNNMLVKYLGNGSRLMNISSLYDGEMLNVDSYIVGLNNFYRAFDGNQFVLRSIILNTFFDLNMPLGKVKRPLFDNYAYFVLSAASFITVAAAIGYAGKNIRDNFKRCVAVMSRSFAHSNNTAYEITDNLKRMGITTPAHLALIIK